MTALMKNIRAKLTTQIELYGRPTGKELRGQSWKELNASWMAAAEALDSALEQVSLRVLHLTEHTLPPRNRK